MDLDFQITFINSYDVDTTHKLMHNSIAIAFNRNYTAFAIDIDHVLVYSNLTMSNYITNILDDINIEKFVTRPLPVIKSQFKGITCRNCQSIFTYINEHGDQRTIPELKRILIDQGKASSLIEQAANIAIMTLRYKLAAVKPIEKTKRLHFNKRRDCYLLYLTAYNDILSQFGPLTFSTLINKVKAYPYLCRTNMSPGLALEGLVKVGALVSNQRNSIISLPS